MKTYYGTYTNINESDIVAIYDEFKFYFTSNCVKNKFIENVDYFVELEELKITNKFNVDIDMKTYLAVCYYKKIQKKGFRIERIGMDKKIENFNFKAINIY